MKWKTKRYTMGEQRTVTKFLLIPKTIGDETRWLERTSYVEHCYAIDVFNCPLWREIKWWDN